MQGYRELLRGKLFQGKTSGAFQNVKALFQIRVFMTVAEEIKKKCSKDLAAKSCQAFFSVKTIAQSLKVCYD